MDKEESSTYTDAQRKYYQTHKEEINKKNLVHKKAYRERNRERIRERDRLAYQRKKENVPVSPGAEGQSDLGTVWQVRSLKIFSGHSIE